MYTNMAFVRRNEANLEMHLIIEKPRPLSDEDSHRLAELDRRYRQWDLLCREQELSDTGQLSEDGTEYSISLCPSG